MRSVAFRYANQCSESTPQSARGGVPYKGESYYQLSELPGPIVCTAVPRDVRSRPCRAVDRALISVTRISPLNYSAFARACRCGKRSYQADLYLDCKGCFKLILAVKYNALGLLYQRRGSNLPRTRVGENNWYKYTYLFFLTNLYVHSLAWF